MLQLPHGRYRSREAYGLETPDLAILPALERRSTDNFPFTGDVCPGLDNMLRAD